MSPGDFFFYYLSNDETIQATLRNTAIPTHLKICLNSHRQAFKEKEAFPTQATGNVKVILHTHISRLSYNWLKVHLAIFHKQTFIHAFTP